MQLDMTKGSPVQLITKFIIPLIIGNIFQQLYSMVDTIIVGRFVGVEALAAVGATGSICFLILGFTQGLTTGFTVLTAQRYGAGDLEGMRKSIANAAMLSVVVTFVMTMLSVVCMDWLLTIMNTPQDIYEMAKEYIVIICSGICCSVLYNILASILRAIGNSVVPLVLLIISSAINIVLDYVLIVYVHMGVGGAAVATVVSQGISGIFCLFYIVKKVPLLHISRRNWVPDAWCMKNQLMIGIPMALQFSITAVGTILVQAALNLLGSTAVAAYSVACKVEQLVTQPFLAMGATMATYSAQNRGINDLQRIRQGVKVSNRMSAIYSIVIYFVICSLLPYAIRLFITENIETVYGYAEIYIRICGLFFIPLGMIFIYRNTMQGCGFAFWPMMGGVVELLVRCVAAFVATKMLSYEGVCIANAGAWLGAGLFLWICYHYVMKRMMMEKQRFDEVPIKQY